MVLPHFIIHFSMDFPWKKPTNLGDPPLKSPWSRRRRASFTVIMPSRSVSAWWVRLVGIFGSEIPLWWEIWRRIGKEDWNRGSKTLLMFCVMLFEGMILSPQIAETKHLVWQNGWQMCGSSGGMTGNLDGNTRSVSLKPYVRPLPHHLFRKPHYRY